MVVVFAAGRFNQLVVATVRPFPDAELRALDATVGDRRLWMIHVGSDEWLAAPAETYVEVRQ